MLVIILLVDLPLLILLIIEIMNKRNLYIYANILIMIWLSLLVLGVDNGRSFAYFSCGNTIRALKRRLELERDYDVLKAINCYQNTYEKTEDVGLALKSFRDELDQLVISEIKKSQQNVQPNIPDNISQP
jgi:hypothetical protein